VYWNELRAEIGIHIEKAKKVEIGVKKKRQEEKRGKKKRKGGKGCRRVGCR